MKLKDIIIKFDKSPIKAGEGYEKGMYPLYTCSPIVNKYLDTYLFDDEAISLSTGGNFSAHYINGKFNVSTDCFVIKTDKFNMKYFYYYILSKSKDIQNMFRGAGLKHLNKNELMNLDIKNIRQEEQENVVKNLDNINTLIDNTQKQLDMLDNLIKSQFVKKNKLAIGGVL